MSFASLISIEAMDSLSIDWLTVSDFDIKLIPPMFYLCRLGSYMDESASSLSWMIYSGLAELANIGLF